MFYIIGIGFYSLFITPLNLPAALGVEALNDLESKTVSVVIVILAITFLEHFIRWENPTDIVQFGVALGIVAIALVFFQRHAHEAKASVTRDTPEIEEHAQVQLFRMIRFRPCRAYPESLPPNCCAPCDVAAGTSIINEVHTGTWFIQPRQA